MLEKIADAINSGFDKKPAIPSFSDTENDGFSAVMSRLCELPYLEEDEDYTRPTEFSFKRACAILIETKDALKSTFPHASFSTSETGAVQIYWRKGNFLIQLILPYEVGGNEYIHVLKNNEPKMYHNPTGKHLAEILNEFHEQN